MDKIETKKIGLNDIEQLQIIGRLTFRETFTSGNTDENMQKYLDEGFSIEKLSAEISDENSEFHFAIYDNKVIGYLKLNFGHAQTEFKDPNSVEIERIYVMKEFYGKQVGQILFNIALNIARKSNANYLWLGVWEENPRAINFYKKNGFIAFDKHIFKLVNEEQTDILMKLKLVMQSDHEN